LGRSGWAHQAQHKSGSAHQTGPTRAQHDSSTPDFPFTAPAKRRCASSRPWNVRASTDLGCEWPVRIASDESVRNGR
jgi:hypothetical protein